MGSQFIESINPFYESLWQSVSKPLEDCSSNVSNLSLGNSEVLGQNLTTNTVIVSLSK